MSSTEDKNSTYPPHTPIWVSDPTTVWKCVEFKSLDNKKLIYIENNEEKIIQPPPTTLHLKNPEILIGQNDLTSLSYLHEPAVLYNLNYRFNLNTIYTYCGIVLVAINPYEELDIYNRETILAYRGAGGQDLDPHIFAVAEQAYNKMERESKNQSIIVSGESGAGKTVSAKYAMRYFATVGGSENETQIEQKVLASSPIMEAIGNAKTTRNDNSSRFGKYVELNFNNRYSITSASMRTYLLEKSRVVYQSATERNYHIFYQMCSFRNKHNEISELFLQDSSAFNYTSQCTDDLNDDFVETVNAFVMLGFGLDDRRHFFKVLSSILQLGNVEFCKDQDFSSIKKDDVFLENFCSLLTLESDVIRKSLTTRPLKSGTETVVKKLSYHEAVNSRDALAKLLYSELFNWVVENINKALAKYAASGDTVNFIGVLDIYGFETFEVNSFEQFCINYANEKLQQQFNMHVFKLEQEEYVREGISWTFIDFYDNQPCIDLIEAKLGILDLLEEECRMINGNDQSWLIKLHNKCTESKHYMKPKINSDKVFIIKHFADNVEYLNTGFIEKNRDQLAEELILAVVSKNDFLKTVLKDKLPAGVSSPGSLTAATKTTKKLLTVGSSFRTSLSLLMNSLNATTPHYVRCIKPNDQKLPFVFDPQRAVQQLRACGVLETIRISAAGFPSRWTYADFYNRYQMFSDKSTGKDSKLLVKKLIKDEENYRLGKTKVFFRAGQVAYLERIRLEKLQHSAVMIQKYLHMNWRRNRYLRLKKSTLLLQRYGRGLLARRLAESFRRTKAAVKIQAWFRMQMARQMYKTVLFTVVRIQAMFRGKVIRLRKNQLLKEKRVVEIQRFWRGCLARKAAGVKLKKIVLAQCVIRRFIAKRRLRKLKKEAKSIEHVKQLNKGLENKIISLQQKIESLNKENHSLKASVQDLDKIKHENAGLREVEKEFKSMKVQLDDLVAQNKLSSEQLDSLRTSQVDLVNEKKEIEEQIQAKNSQLQEKDKIIDELKAQIDKLLDENERLSKNFVKADSMHNELEKYKGMYQDLLAQSYDQKERPVPAPRFTKVKSEEQPQNIPSTKMSSNRRLEEEVEELKARNRSLEEERLQMREMLEHKQQNGGTVASKSDIKGMIEYKQEDLSRILRAIIVDLNPSVAVTAKPSGLPAFIIFMMIRWTDYINDDEKVQSLLTKAIQDIKKVVRKRGQENKEILILWLVNVLRLLHTLKQYSGDDNFSSRNTPRQNVQVLRNFDLFEYRQVLSDHALWINVMLLKALEDELQPLIIPALLETKVEHAQMQKKDALISLLSVLQQMYNLLQVYGLDLTLIHQIFRQLLYYICAGAMNYLMLRKEFCHFAKGMEIRYNVSRVEEWCRDRKMNEEVTSTLNPLIQCSQILQARKSDSDCQNICDICDSLTISQVVKILSNYSSKDGVETDKVSKSLIEKVRETLLKNRNENYDHKNSSLLMDTKYTYPVQFPFNPSPTLLEEIRIPDSFGINSLIKLR